jgi:hypothetical protein
MKPSTLVERFWRNVEQGAPMTCWPWKGSRTVRGGYGQLNEKGKLIKAHRFVLEWKLGRKITRGKMALHSCGNAPCCNPRHIYEGTAAQNNQDAKRHGTLYKIPVLRGEDSPSAKLTVAQVKEIRSSEESHTALAKKFGVTKQAIFRIRKRLSWRSV